MQNVGAQSNYQIGTLPAININKSLKNSWRLNFKWESRQLLKRNRPGIPGESGFDYILSDFALVLSKKVGLNNSIAAGYQIRLRENQLTHRSIQQFTIVKRYTGFRLAHRLASDQTYALGESTEFRLRYRIAAELPLNGEAVDPREFYFKVNNEYLNSFQGKDYDLEIRIVPVVGYVFTDNNKLEFGLNYRASSFLESQVRHSYWIAINWFLKI